MGYEVIKENEKYLWCITSELRKKLESTNQTSCDDNGCSLGNYDNIRQFKKRQKTIKHNYYFYLFSHIDIFSEINIINPIIDYQECGLLYESEVYTELDFLTLNFTGSRQDIKMFEFFLRNNINLNYCCGNFGRYLKTSKRELYTHTILDFAIEKFKLLRRDDIVTSIKLKQMVLKK